MLGLTFFFFWVQSWYNDGCCFRQGHGQIC